MLQDTSCKSPALLSGQPITAKHTLCSNHIQTTNSNKIDVNQIISLSYSRVNYAKCPNLMTYYFRVVATTPEKTHNQKFLTFETILNRFLVKNYPKNKKKVATPYLHGASAIRRPRRRPDALNVILRLNRCLDGMR